MLLLHQNGSAKVGEVIRYTITYTPSRDRILPSPSHLHVKIKNTSAIAMRAAYLHGPYTLHVAAYPSTFDPNDKTKNPRRDGVPQFEPNVKAGGSFTAKIPIPENIRVTGHSQEPAQEGQKPGSITWIIEVTSQIIFSTSAAVHFEVLVSRDERSLEYSFAAVGSQQSEPGQVHDHQPAKQKKHTGNHAAHQKGVFSKALRLVVDDTTSLWNKPELPECGQQRRKLRVSGEMLRRKSTDKGPSLDQSSIKPKKKRKIHLVILTHGLHSNLSADLLYLKESIDATAKHARESARDRRKAERAKAYGASCGKKPKDEDTPGGPSTAPLSGGQEDLHDEDADSEHEDDEEIIVRGFNGNAVKTESGIQYLGKRLAKWILDITYPDQPYKPLRKSMTKKLSDALSAKSSQDSEGKPSHEGSSIRLEDSKASELAYTFTSISFVGHSLGGLIQLYAIGYIQKHAPGFFDQLKPINFIALASPLLGLSNENPMYVKFALDFGLVGRTGQDLGLTWRPPTIAKSGWASLMDGLGVNSQKDQQQDDPGAKPLLRILPTGPAHRVLRQFRNRTVYSNVVNDGIVPLRTSCLLFLDWRGLGKVEKARRENGLIGTMVGWGWAEVMGQSASPNPSRLEVNSDNTSQVGSDAGGNPGDTAVPQPAEDATNDDETNPPISPVAEQQFMNLHHPPGPEENRSGSTGTSPTNTIFGGLFNFIRPTGKTTKTDMKMFKRSQTVGLDNDSDTSVANTPQRAGSPEPIEGPEVTKAKRPPATRGDTILNDPTNALAPPKTTIFESAGDILNPPIPPTSWIIDPASRTRTIFHDRVYHPEDIPPPPPKRPRNSRSISGTDVSQHSNTGMSTDSRSSESNMRVEEKIARAYHKDLSWRKVLVRLEPDAHNNMIVRRMFANAYGWPVIKHLCDTHFGDTYAATTRDEDEPATDRAKGIDNPVGEHGEHVKGQASAQPPRRPTNEMRESADELAPLRPTSGESPDKSTTAASTPGEWDDAYFDTDDEDGRATVINRLWTPPTFMGQKGRAISLSKSPTLSSPVSKSSTGGILPEQTDGADEREDAKGGTSEAEIAEFLTTTPPPIEGHRGLGHAPTSPSGKAATISDVGLGKSAEEMVASSPTSAKPLKKTASESVITEQVARSISKGEDAPPAS